MLRARRPVAFAITLAVLVFSLIRPAAADKKRVDELIKLIKTKPAGMDALDWKEKRRDAVRELGGQRDDRIGPLMVEIIESEDFDIIAEHAVEVIGKIKYKGGAPVLRRVIADNSRDRDIRAAARKSLRQLGEPDEPEPAPVDDGDTDTGPPTTGPQPGPRDTTPPAGDGGDGDGGGDGGDGGGAAVGGGPSFEDDTLGATEQLTLAAGGVRLEYDTINSRPALDGDIAAFYERTLDHRAFAYRYGGTASVVGGVVDFEQSGVSSRAAIGRLDGHGEARFYFGQGSFYGVGQGFLGGGVDYIFVNREDNTTNTDETLFYGDLGIALGIGYGRVLDKGVAVRLERIELALKRANLLGRPITPDLAEKIYQAWWALRGRHGAHHHLVATVRLLREAGVLLGEPDASTTYKILMVLTDGQLDHRLEGFDVDVGIGETLSARDDSVVMGTIEEGRIETVLGRARYGWQSADGTNEIVGDASARYRILADDGDPEPWTTLATVAWRKFFYSDYFDPIGGLEFAAQIGASDVGLDGSETASLLGGSAGWVWSPNRASWFRIAGEVSMLSGELFLGVSFEALYGLLDVGFIGRGAYRND